ncbi:hypothetical protein DOTSEDRAFT_171502 [Dothistroma septosporum NZE10]|uniref:Oxidoreductase n=1 Tax=Dothistroma septosporum (strain NZE10 / CBS 128990) TaxID=675120 RepID=N1PSD9_DOTSN|nr:hypothetical protein DOTSEDRAFT_171502 [Dothistroma septosporum NZE10]
MAAAFRKPVFDAKKEIGSLNGKVILITGGTGGLGRETVLSFVAHEPAHIYFTGRSQPSADKVLAACKTRYPQIPVTFLRCDLADLEDVQRAAKRFLSLEHRLDILLANAGIMSKPPGVTKQGYELQFGTNHMGHALLVQLLTPLLQATAKESGDARIVWDTSLAYSLHPPGGTQFSSLKTPQNNLGRIFSPWVRYAQSKLANLLYAREYAKHHPEITSVSIHPGVSATGLVEGLSTFYKVFVYITSWWMMVPPETCAWNQQWAATAPLGKGGRQVESGGYYEPVGFKGGLTRSAGDDGLAAKLWEWTEAELEKYSL